MAKKIKGITVQIGGDTSGLTKALTEADKSLAATQRELNDVQKALKFNPESTELMAQKQKLLSDAIKETSDKLKALEDNQEKARKAFEANADYERRYAPLKEAIDKASASLKELKAKQEEAKKQFEAGNISAEDYEKVKQETKNAEQALKDLKDQKKQLDSEFENGHISEEEYREYQREVERTRGQLQNLQTELRNTSITSEEVNKKLTTFKDHAKEDFAAIAKAAAAITAALVAIGKKAVDVGMEFDSSMSQVAATMGYSVEEINTEGSEAQETFRKLRDTALALGKSTSKSATEASEALNYMALAGYDAETAIAMLPKVLDLSSAGEIELAKASDMVTDAQSALGLSIEDTEKLIDQMAKTASKSNTSVEQLGEGILNIGATAKDMKGGTQELTEVLGLLADNGIKGAEGGTKLRNILLKLEAPTDKAAAKLEELGVKAYDSDGKLRSMQDIFTDLNAAMADMTEQDKSLAKATIFNARDLGAVNALLNTTADRWNELGDAIEDSAGAAHDMAEVQLDNLAGDITLFKSAVEGAEITISDRLTPTLRDMVQFGTEAVGKLADGFGRGGLSGAVAAAHKIIADDLSEQATLIFGVETAVESLVAAYATYKGVTLFMEGVEALKAMTTWLRTATVETEALNTAQASNPLAMVAALAVGAAKAVSNLIDIQTDLMDEVNDSYDLLSDKQKEIVDNAKEVSQSISASREEYEKNQKTIDDQVESYQLMADKLFELNKETNLSTSARKQMKVYVDKLNGSIKGMNIELDEESGHLKTLKSDVDALIDSYEKQAKAQAAQQHLTELYDQQISAEIAHKKAIDETTAAESELYDLVEKRNMAARAYNDALSETEGKWTKTEEQIDKENRLREAFESAEAAVQAQNDRLGDLRATSANINQDLSDITEDIGIAKGVMSEYSGAVAEAADETQEGFDKIAEGSAEMAETVVSNLDISEKVEEYTGKIEQLISEYENKLNARTGTLQNWFELNATVSGEEANFNSLSSTLDKQISDMTQWSADIKKLEDEGINQNFLDKLKDAGPQSQQFINAILSVPPEKRKEYADKWDEAYQGAADIAQKQLEGMRKETEDQISTMLKEIEKMSPEFAATFEGLANSAVDGYILKIKERLPELKEWGAAIGKETMDGEKEETDSHSPSKEWAKLAKNDVDGYAKGYEDNMSKAVNAAKDMADKAMSAAGTTSPSMSGASISSINTAVRAAANAQTAAAVQAVPSLTAEDIAKAVKESFDDLMAGSFTERIYLDSDQIAQNTYKKIDILIGNDAEMDIRGYAR